MTRQRTIAACIASVEAEASLADLSERLGHLVAGPDGKIRAHDHVYDASDEPLRGLALDCQVRPVLHVPQPFDRARAARLDAEWLDTERQMEAAFDRHRIGLSSGNKRQLRNARERYAAECKAIMEQQS